MILGHRIALSPNKTQSQHLAQSCGVARFAYNWALAQWNDHWEKQKALPEGVERAYITEGDLRKQFNAIKRDEFPWSMEVTKYAPQEAIKQLGKAFNNFFKSRAKYPRFKKKFVNDRFSIGNDQVQVKGKYVRLPKFGWIKMHEAIRFNGAIKSITVSRSAEKWFISFAIDVEDHTRYYKQTESQGVVAGLDVGVKHLAVLSNGEKIKNTTTLKKSLSKMRRLQRSLSRRKKGSNRRKLMKMRIAKLHQRISNIRKDSLHKMTTDLSQRFSVIGIETLNVKGMMKNKRLALSLSDASFYEIKRQLLYKTQLRGGCIVEADMFFPSSKLCNECGWKNDDLTLTDRDWTCRECGVIHDRDVNAAMNLKRYAASKVVKVHG